MMVRRSQLSSQFVATKTMRMETDVSRRCVASFKYFHCRIVANSRGPADYISHSRVDMAVGLSQGTCQAFPTHEVVAPCHMCIDCHARCRDWPGYSRAICRKAGKSFYSEPTSGYLSGPGKSISYEGLFHGTDTHSRMRRHLDPRMRHIRYGDTTVRMDTCTGARYNTTRYGPCPISVGGKKM